MANVINKTKDLMKSSAIIDKTKDLIEELPRKLTTTIPKVSWQNRIVYLLTLAVIVYFAVMDLLTYIHIQRLPVRTKNPDPVQGGFNYFNMLSVKGMMEDQLSCHINWPLCELFEQVTHISNHKFITPNGISIFGALISIPAAKLLSMESLLCKRVAVLIFVFRLWIDGLDGVVFRMQNLSEEMKHTQLSVRHSSGWFVDTVCDFFAGFCFLYGVYKTLRQKVPPNSSNSILPVTCCQLAASPSRPSSPTLDNKSPREISNRTILIRLIWTVCTISAGSAFWDYYVAQYRKVFEVTLSSTQQQELQSEIMKSMSTFVIFWCWRLLNGVSFVNTAYLFVVFDKVWEYIHFVQIYGTSCLLLLAIMTCIHLNSIRTALGL